MKTRIALFALALALPLAACADEEPDMIETNTTTIETPDVDATMDDMGDDMDAAGDATMDNMEEVGNDMDAAATEAGNEVEEALDGDDNM